VSKEIFLIVIMLFVFSNAKALNNDKRTLEVKKVSENPKIDGILNESVWQKAAVAEDFVQYEPYNGGEPSLPTEVKVLYTDQAIYFGAIMYDNNPDSITRDLGVRDEFSGINSDLFTVLISTFNDGVNAVEFMVSASGVQSDGKHNGNHGDSNWDGVWESKVKVTEFGWVAEIKIPYSALRFPKEDNQKWGVHFFRHIRRFREWSTWNYVDINVQGKINQMGELTGIKNIEPPLRLSVTPYVSAYLENDADNNSWGSNFNAGMDLKWGINQSFTLDMILIPDFGQVQSDDEVLNLSPYEIKYNEKRAFFTEGTELFNKGNIFYSRRVGSRPKDHDKVEDILKENEEIIENPVETKLINATKISGRTDGGLGIGFFNAMTGATEAVIEDTLPQIENISGNDTSLVYARKKYQTQGFVNYNMLVLDQSLKNNSFISFANTNVMHVEENYTANVTASEFSLMNRENSFKLEGAGAVSQKYTDSVETGHKYNVEFSKTKGNFLFEFMHNTESDTYDPNDMGYIRQNNESTWYLELAYRKNDPFWKVLNWRNEINFVYQNLYKPRKFAQFEINMSSRTTFARNYLSVGTFLQFNPVKNYDHFEPRVEGWKFERPRSFVNETWISTDYRRAFALDVRVGGWKAFDYDRYGYWLTLSPRVRFNDKWLFIYRFNVNTDYNSYGYVDDYRENDEPVIDFGKRDVATLTNTINTSYIFHGNMSLNLRVRHYWSRVEYNDFYKLQKDGTLSSSVGYDTYGDDENYNYNAFTVDMKFLWRFAPGSDISVVWKNAIYTNESDIINNFMNNLNNTLESSQINSISLKILYYLDYQYLNRNR